MRIDPTVRRMALILLLTWISTGCYVPVSMQAMESRQHYPATREDFSLGVTNRTEVMLKMGEPDKLSPDEQVLTYRWAQIRGIVSVSGCDATPVVETTTFVFSFDEGAVLKSLDIIFDEPE